MVEQDLKEIENRLNELKIEAEELESKVWELEKLIEIMQKIRPDPLVKDILFNVKNDKNFFVEFVKFLERYGKRNIILAITRKNFLNGCKNIKFV